MSWEAFDMDYFDYVIEHFPEFEREHPRLSRRFADTIDRTCSTCSWMTDDAFQDVIGDAVDTFLGEAPAADILIFTQDTLVGGRQFLYEGMI